MAEYIDKSDVNGLVQIGWSGDAIVTAIINDGISSFPAIPIPEGATNGDMIMAMFPNAIIEINEIGSMVHVKYNNHTCWVNYELEWWNAPYKGVEK